MKFKLSNSIISLITITMFFNAKILKGQVTLTGKISDSTTNTPLELVTAKLNAAGAQSKIISSDSSGGYSFYHLIPGNYTLVFSFINFKEKALSLYLGRDTVINISMARMYQQLNTVDVNARRPIIERKIDRLVFNVSNNVNVIGADAMELLSKTPQVKVDGTSISIIGKDVVTIMLNDRPLQLAPEAQAAYLRSIPAELIERIEVMTNPPSIYSAQGSSGIVNIITKKKRELGYNGSANLNLTKSKAEGIYGGVNLNYNKANFRYFANLNTAKGSHIPTYSRSVFYEKQTQEETVRTKELSQFVNGEVGFDAELSKTSTLGVSMNLFYSYPYQTNTVRSLFVNNQTRIPDSISEQSNQGKVSYRSYSSNIHYAKSLDTFNRKRIVIDADLTSTSFDRPNTIDNNLYSSNGNPILERGSRTISNNDQTTEMYSLNGIIYLPGKEYELSFGGRINFIKNKNDVLLDIDNANKPDIHNENLFTFNENTQALFINYRTDLGKRWSFQSGLRGEFTQTKGHSYTIPDSINKNTYFNLFPTVYLLYKLNSKNTLTVNYGRRINRPGFNSFNPYRQYHSQYQYSEGNPFLQPYISNNFSLSETYNDNLNISVQYSFSNDQVGAINIVQDNSPTSVSKLYNFLSTQSFLTSVNYNIDKIKWLQSINEFDVYYNKSKSSSIYTSPVTEGWGATVSSDNSFFFNKTRTIAVGLYFSYQFPDVSGISRNNRYYFFDLSGKYLLFNNKLQLAFKLSDLFKTKDIRGRYLINGILTSDYANNDSRRFTISLRYYFGNSNLKEGQSHSGETNKGRTSN